LGPLDGYNVVELGHALAGPMAATFMADFGADVIKVERTGAGDSLRAMGPQAEGVGLWWLVAGRNKRSLVLDLKAREGIAILRDLLEKADVLVENYRPGVMERLGLSWEEVHKLNPRLVMLSISGFGQTGPYSSRGGFGKIGEAFSGATNLTGHRDQAALHPGYSLGDAVCALMGAFGVTMALLSREKSGVGQLVDLALYEPLFRLIEWQLPMHVLAGLDVKRNGPRFPFQEAFITDICQTSDGESIVVSAATSDSIGRVHNLLLTKGILAAPTTSTEEMTDALRVWVAQNSKQAVLDTFREHNLVNGLVYTPTEMLDDPHMRARGNILQIPHPVLGSIPMPSVIPRLSATPGAVHWPGPSLGQHTEEVLRGHLGYAADRVTDLRARGIIG